MNACHLGLSHTTTAPRAVSAPPTSPPTGLLVANPGCLSQTHALESHSTSFAIQPPRASCLAAVHQAELPCWVCRCWCRGACDGPRAAALLPDLVFQMSSNCFWQELPSPAPQGPSEDQSRVLGPGWAFTFSSLPIPGDLLPPHCRLRVLPQPPVLGNCSAEGCLGDRRAPPAARATRGHEGSGWQTWSDEW